MKTQDKIRDRLRELCAEGHRLKVGGDFGQRLNEQHTHDCRGWLTEVQGKLYLIFGNSPHPYRSGVDSICAENRGYLIQTQVGDVTAILERLITDLDNGLIFSIESRVRATVFEDFLEEARQYAKTQHIREAGVFAAAVFEDTLRSLSQKCGIKEEKVQTDRLISELANTGVLTAVQAKRARASADVRNKALHAQWNEISLGDVEALIVFTEELITLLDEN